MGPLKFHLQLFPIQPTLHTPVSCIPHTTQAIGSLQNPLTTSTTPTDFYTITKLYHTYAKPWLPIKLVLHHLLLPPTFSTPTHL